MHTPKRGEIWQAEFGPLPGQSNPVSRPVMIVSTNSLNESGAGKVVVVVPLSSRRQQTPFDVRAELEDGTLPTESWLRSDGIRSLSPSRLCARLGQVTPKTMEKVERQLLLLLFER
jgi:mRNA-degrading endonuclease toxin of MazEF toxin-antitoxin module